MVSDDCWMVCSRTDRQQKQKEKGDVYDVSPEGCEDLGMNEDGG